MKTDTQARVLEAIRDKPAATVRDLVAALGLSSTASVQYHLDTLVRKDRIARRLCRCCGSWVWEIR